MDRGAGWAIVHRVAKSRTRLKRPVCTHARTHSRTLGEALPGGSVVKKPSAMQELQEMWVQSLGQEDPLDKETATCSAIPT